MSSERSCGHWKESRERAITRRTEAWQLCIGDSSLSWISLKTSPILRSLRHVKAYVSQNLGFRARRRLEKALGTGYTARRTATSNPNSSFLKLRETDIIINLGRTHLTPAFGSEIGRFPSKTDVKRVRDIYRIDRELFDGLSPGGRTIPSNPNPLGTSPSQQFVAWDTPQ